MRHFPLLAALAVATLPMPAAAAEVAGDEQDLARAAEQMRDPERQEKMVAMAEAMLGAMMQMPVGKLLQATATIAGEDPDAVDPDATLAELAGPDAEDAPRQVSQAMPRMMEAMGVLTEALRTMLPELRKAGEEMARNLPEDLAGEAPE